MTARDWQPRCRLRNALDPADAVFVFVVVAVLFAALFALLSGAAPAGPSSPDSGPWRDAYCAYSQRRGQTLCIHQDLLDTDPGHQPCSRIDAAFGFCDRN
jgi:hypothetical protein